MNRIEKAKQMEKAHFPKVSFLQEDPEMQQIMKLHLFADVYGHGTLDFRCGNISLSLLWPQITLRS